MRTLFLFLFASIFCVNSFSQDYYTDFADGTLHGWTNFDTTTGLLTVEPNNTSTGFNLQKVCDGTNSPIGEMTIINTENWIGNYFYDGGAGDEYLINLDYITMRNNNNFDLHIRYGFTGANGYQVVTTDPIVVPALSDWEIYESHFDVIFPGLENLTIITDTGTLPWLEVYDNVHDLFEEVVEVRIFHNPDPLFDGKIVTGNLDIDVIEALLLLSNEDKKATEVAIFPNPAKDFISIKTNGDSEGVIMIYNMLGEKLIEQDFITSQKKFDISGLNNGVYFLRINSESTITTKKFIKG